MFGLGAILLIVIVVVVAITSARTRRAGTERPLVVAPPASGAAPAGAAPPGAAPIPAGVGDSLDRWVAAGLLSADQAAAIRTFEAAAAAPVHAPKVRRVPPIAEALGYLGGLLGVIGLTVFVAGFWRDMAPAGRLSLSAVVTAVLVAIGFAVRAGTDDSLLRLRSFVWLVGSAAAGVLGGVVANDLLDATHGRSITTGAAVGVLVVGGALWAWRDRPAQALSAFAAVPVAVGAAVWNLSGSVLAGLLVLAIGAAYLGIGLARLVPSAWVVTIVGAGAALGGSIMTGSEWNEKGGVLTAATMVVVLALAESPRLHTTVVERTMLSVIGLPTALASAGPAIAYFGDDAGIVTGAVVLVLGSVFTVSGSLGLVRHRVPVELVGGLVVVGGAAAMGMQSVAVATLIGLLAALAMLALGTRPGLAFLSITGSIGLLVNVPWSISHFFPGENRAPLLIAVSGLLLVAIAVALTRMGSRFRSDLRA